MRVFLREWDDASIRWLAIASELYPITIFRNRLLNLKDSGNKSRPHPQTVPGHGPNVTLAN